MVVLVARKKETIQSSKKEQAKILRGVGGDFVKSNWIYILGVYENDINELLELLKSNFQEEDDLFRFENIIKEILVSMTENLEQPITDDYFIN